MILFYGFTTVLLYLNFYFNKYVLNKTNVLLLKKEKLRKCGDLGF